jgi:hypothetical protein
MIAEIVPFPGEAKTRETPLARAGGAAAHWKPTGYFWRKDIDQESDILKLRRIARVLVAELELHKQVIFDQGLMPPVDRVSPSQASAFEAAGISWEEWESSTFLRM